MFQAPADTASGRRNERGQNAQSNEDFHKGLARRIRKVDGISVGVEIPGSGEWVALIPCERIPSVKPSQGWAEITRPEVVETRAVVALLPRKEVQVRSVTGSGDRQPECVVDVAVDNNTLGISKRPRAVEPV